MTLHPIKLTATATNWRLFIVRKEDPSFLKFQEKVLIRDRHTCQFCGFQTQKSQEVINLDGNYHNNRLSNLITACIFCTQCFFLEAIGKGEFGGGTLICLPEMTQGEINALCHVLFIEMVFNTANANQAKNIYRGLKLRSQVVEQRLGEGMSNPALLGQLLIDVQTKDKQQLDEELSTQLRVLPNLVKSLPQIESWAFAGLQELSKVEDRE